MLKIDVPTNAKNLSDTATFYEGNSADMRRTADKHI